MIPKLVTFDCAQTLVSVPEDWTLGRFAVECARHIGLLPSDDDAHLYMRMYYGRMQEFLEINRSLDFGRAEAFWQALARDWMVATGLPLDQLSHLLGVSDALLFGSKSRVFRLFDDVIPCLDKLDSMGIRAAVVSNWDYSLDRVLRMAGIYDRFVVVKASLVEGVEKPDPRLFQIALNQAGFLPAETFHVGDSYDDDFVGAQAANIPVALIDRNLTETKVPFIRSLTEITEAFVWQT